MIPCRAPRRPTTNSPIRREADTSTADGVPRRRLASESSWSSIPTPESAISTTIEPSCARRLDMTTCESGG